LFFEQKGKKRNEKTCSGYIRPKKIGKCTFVRISKVTFMSSNMNGVRSLTWPLIEEWLSLLNYFPSFFSFSVFKTKILANNSKLKTLKIIFKFTSYQNIFSNKKHHGSFLDFIIN